MRDEGERAGDDDDVEGHRLASNDNETVVRRGPEPADVSADDVEGHRLAANDNEIVRRGTPEPASDDDVEGHRLATNQVEIVVDLTGHRAVA